MPSVSFSGTASRNDTRNTARAANGSETVSDSAYRSESYNLSLRQPLFRKASWDQFQEGRALAARAGSGLRQERQALALRVAAEYFEALLAQAQFDMETAKHKTLEQTLVMADKALHAGPGTLTDVYEVRARLDLAAAFVLEADNARQNARAALQATLNREPDALAGVDLKLLPPSTTEESPAPWLERAEAANPALQSLRSEVRVAAEEADKARAGHYPALDLFAQHRRAKNELETSLNRDYVTNLVGLQLSVPIFSGGYTHAASAQAHERLERARQRLEAGRREVGLNVRKEFGNRRQNALRVAALTQAVVSVEQALSGTEKGVIAGTRTTIDVLNAQDLVFRTKIELAKASYQFVMSSLRLEDATGTLDENAVKTANGWLAAAP